PQRRLGCKSCRVADASRESTQGCSAAAAPATLDRTCARGRVFTHDWSARGSRGSHASAARGSHASAAASGGPSATPARCGGRDGNSTRKWKRRPQPHPHWPPRAERHGPRTRERREAAMNTVTATLRAARPTFATSTRLRLTPYVLLLALPLAIGVW